MILASDIGLLDVFWIVPLSIVCMVIAAVVQQGIGFKNEDGKIEDPNDGSAKGCANYFLFIVVMCIAFFLFKSCGEFLK